jgi:hypothetical protein
VRDGWGLVRGGKVAVVGVEDGEWSRLECYLE